MATRSGKITALAPEGRTLWQAEAGGAISGPAEGAGDRVVVPLDAGAVLLEASSGRTVARLEPAAGASRAALLPAGVVLAGADGTIALARPADGGIVWRATAPAPPSVRPAQCGDLILLGGSDGSLTALRAGDGSRAWSRRIGAAVTTDPACDRGRAYVGSADNRIYALKLTPRRFRVLWSYLTGGDVAGKPLLFGQHLIVTSYDTYLYSLKTRNGHLAWKVRLGRRPRPDSLLLGDLLLVAPLDSERLEAFRLPGGAPAGHLALSAGEDRFVTHPVSAGGVVALGAARYGAETARLIGVEPGRTGAPAAAGGSGP